MKKIITVGLFLVCCFPGISQVVEIEQCQQWAQENYPLMQRYDLINQTETFTLKNLTKGWLPQVGVNAEATIQSAVPTFPEVLMKLLESMGTKMDGMNYFHYNGGLDIQQMIYDGGAISAQKRIAEATADVNRSSVDVQMYALRERINDLCFGILLLNDRLLLNEEVLKTIGSNSNRLQSLYEGGVAMKSDVDAINAELAMAKQQRTDITAQRDAFISVLKLFVGHDLSDIVKPNVVSGPGMARPEFTFFDKKLSLTDAKERALNSSVIPKIGLFAQGYYGYTGLDLFQDIMSPSPTWNGIAGIKASWNISSFYTKKNDRAKLSLERRMVENDRDVFVFNQNIQSQQEDSNIERYRSLIQEDDNIYNLRHSVREATEAKLESGIIDVNDLIQEISKENQAAINRSVHEIELLQHQFKQQIIKGE